MMIKKQSKNLIALIIFQNHNGTYDHCITLDQLLKKYYLPVFYTLEFILGVLANGTVLWAYIFGMKNWSTGNIYLFNLCLSDFAFLCTLPWLVESYANETWIYGPIMCKSNRFLLHANLYTSVLFLTCVSMDRYMLIKNPFKKHVLQKKRLAILISIGVWILVTTELLPMLTFIGLTNMTNDTNCHSYASSGDPVQNLIYSTCLTVFGFIMPLCGICFFYLKIVILLKKRNKDLAQVPSLEKPLRLVILAIILFSITFTPYHIMRNIRIASRMDSWAPPQCTKVIINSIYVITRPIAFLNSVINPIFYFLMGDHFRDMLNIKIRQLSNAFKSYYV
ncbi:succinate receptor 1 [Pleurodeles waltl]|uniref:succinate receptor 1 n=1 Tax=Pleurodeles waltl TaxID=8319 RepID=UPI0037095250